MTVYVIVLVVVVLFLVAAYRSLGGADSRPLDVRWALGTVHAQLSSAVDGLQALVAGGVSAPDPDAMRSGRRSAASAQQTLDRLPTSAELGEVEGTARTLLAAAAEDAGWAWRLLQAESASPGIAAAVLALRDHARECCDAAGELLGGRLTPRGEPLDRP